MTTSMKLSATSLNVQSLTAFCSGNTLYIPVFIALTFIVFVNFYDPISHLVVNFEDLDILLCVSFLLASVPRRMPESQSFYYICMKSKTSQN